MAQDLGATYFDLPGEAYEVLRQQGRDVVWAVNQQFLDDAIARGDKFYLASLLKEALPETFYHDEVNYLLDKGYRVVGDFLEKIE